MAQDLEKMFNEAINTADSDDDVAKGKREFKQEVQPVVEEVETEVATEPKPVEEVNEPEQIVEEEQPQVLEPSSEAENEPLSNDNDPEVDLVPEQLESRGGQISAFSGTPEYIEHLVKVLDLYRGLDVEAKELVSKLFETDRESEIISFALVQEVITLDAFQSLSNVHQAEGVDKAFYLVALPDELLQEIGRLTRIFLDKDIEFTDHIKYCRGLESALSEMNDEFVAQTTAVLEMLTMAQEEEAS